VRYHLGSIALGSFIVAVVQFIRAILEYVDKKTKRLQDTNPVVKFFMCCVKYCVWYLEQVLKFINRNAYILVAVKGYRYTCHLALTPRAHVSLCTPNQSYTCQITRILVRPRVASPALAAAVVPVPKPRTIHSKR